jgi:uncharacterized protein YdiU (UPF0061 family)
MHLFNSYALLGQQFYETIHPTPVRDPRLFLWNDHLARQLKIPARLQEDPVSLAHIFSGNRLLPGSQPIATAYAGHQFGHFVPRLGDGRAHLLGDVADVNGKAWDIQLKGSGPTSFSRGGDGRCALGPALREYIMSEAMHYLGVPTTRALCVVTTGETVMREKPLDGAVITRVASSHVRIGTFQYFAAQGNKKALETLFDYTLKRHYPSLSTANNPYTALLQQCMDMQIRLIVHWMRVGFIHGVMNTDNTSLAGETIDYGPCAMLGIYDPATVYSSIDVAGRYAFGNQPAMAQWNLTRFAQCLLPLVDDDPQMGAEQLRPILATFAERFEQAYMTMLGPKIGLHPVRPEDQDLITSLLRLLEDKKLDYTITFHLLTRGVTDQSAAADLEKDLGPWMARWKKRLARESPAPEKIQALMQRNNPVVIPRNHHVEKVIRECIQQGTAEPAQSFLQVLASPYREQKNTSRYQDPPADNDRNYHTFCGT